MPKAQVIKEEVANATKDVFVIGTEYIVNITGFTYIKDWAMIRGTINGVSIGVIIGDKQNFGMRDMFELKHSEGIRAKYTKDKMVNGVAYQQFSLVEILF